MEKQLEEKYGFSIQYLFGVNNIKLNKMARIKLDKQDVTIIKMLIYINKHTDTEIAKMFKVSRKHINSIRNGKRWNYNWED